MKNLLITWTVGLIMLSFPVAAQTKKAKAPAAKQAASVQSLVLAGKITEAVRQAERTPTGAQDALRALFGKADLEIAERQVTGAAATLDAAEKFADAWAKAKKGKPLPLDALKGRKLRLQGIQLSDNKQYAKAEAILKEALDLSKKSKDLVLEGGVHNNLGYALRHQDKMEAAATEFDTARQIAESQKDDLRGASYNFNLGEVLLQLDRTGFAISAFQRAEEQSKRASKPNLEALAIMRQGMAQGRLVSTAPASEAALRQEPLRLLSKAEKMFEQQGDDRNTGWALFLMADQAAYGMKFADASALGERAISYLAKAKDKNGLHRCYFLLMDMYNKLGDTAKSEKYKKLYEESGS